MRGAIFRGGAFARRAVMTLFAAGALVGASGCVTSVFRALPPGESDAEYLAFVDDLLDPVRASQFAWARGRAERTLRVSLREAGAGAEGVCAAGAFACVNDLLI